MPPSPSLLTPSSLLLLSFKKKNICSSLNASPTPHPSQAGANLILLARREEELEKVKQLAIDANKEGGTGKGGEVVCLKVDMSKRAEIDAALAKAKEAVEDIEV